MLRQLKFIPSIALIGSVLLVRAAARGDIYVTNVGTNSTNSSGTVTEYRDSGTTVNSSVAQGLSQPFGIAFSGDDLFVTNNATSTVGEYNIYGQGTNTALISGLHSPYGVAISGADLFVVNSSSGTVGEYTTSGGTIDAQLISGLNHPTGIAVSGTDLFIANGSGGTISKYTTSGTLESAALVSGLSSPSGVAVSGTDLFVVNNGSRTVGKYTTSGGTTNASLIPAASIGFGNGTPSGIAAFESNLFVTSHSSSLGDAVSEYTTSGTTVNAELIFGTALNGPNAIAVEPTNIAQIETHGDGLSDSIDSNAVVTAVLSQPGTVNGFTYTNYSFLVQDSSGSMDIFSPLTGLNYTPTVGDVIEATGLYKPFHQIPELEAVTAISKGSSGNAVPGPVVATIPDLNHGAIALGGPALPAVAGYLFTLNNVTISGEAGPTWGSGAFADESMTITDADGNSMQLFYWPTSYSLDAAFYGTLIPTGLVDMTGFVSSAVGVAEFTPISVTPVPEPASLTFSVLIGTGIRRDRRKQARP